VIGDATGISDAEASYLCCSLWSIINQVSAVKTLGIRFYKASVPIGSQQLRIGIKLNV
jgi:hypothetical protein